MKTRKIGLALGIGLFVLATAVMTRSTGPAIAAELAPPHPVMALTSPPAVIFTNPSIGACGTPTYTLVSATFNQGMNPTTINSGAFFVSQGAIPIVGAVDYITISKVAVFYPGASLAPNTMYTATITTGVQNQSGQPLAADVVWTFTTTNDTSPVGEGMHIFWGDLHNHSSYSDGQGTPVDAYATARANGLDFFALTDHSNQLSGAEWQDVLSQANAATIDSQFVGLRGFEFTHPNGHINVFDTDTYVSESDSNYDTFAEFYTWLDSQPTAIGQFNHPYKTETYDWNFNDYAYNVSGAHKMYLRETSSYPSDQYLLSLDTGWSVGAVDNSDTHRADWGRWRYMGLVAPSLTKEAVLEALRARRTFSVADRNSAVVMRANGHWMGSVISNTATINFVITVFDPGPTDPILALVLYDNGVPVTATTLLSSPILYTWTPTIPGSPSHYYYAKAYYDVDGYTSPSYTSPIWTDTSEAPKWNIYLPIIVRDDANR